jgi:hypothetical protein
MSSSSSLHRFLYRQGVFARIYPNANDHEGVRFGTRDFDVGCRMFHAHRCFIRKRKIIDASACEIALVENPEYKDFALWHPHLFFTQSLLSTIEKCVRVLDVSFSLLLIVS